MGVRRTWTEARLLLDYRALVYLMQRSYVVMTDSGGLQEEAPSCGKPVLVLRQVTKRSEGLAQVVGADRTMIVSRASQMLTNTSAYARMARAVNPYGDGYASSRIVQALLDFRAEATERGSHRLVCSV